VKADAHHDEFKDAPETGVFREFGLAVEVRKETSSKRLHHLAIRATGHESQRHIRGQQRPLWPYADGGASDIKLLLPLKGTRARGMEWGCTASRSQAAIPSTVN
jgi:hypothetical protein